MPRFPYYRSDMRRFLILSSSALLFSSCIFSSPAGDTGNALPYSFEKVPLYGDFPTLTDFKFLPDSGGMLALGRSGKVGYFKMGRSKAELVSAFTIPDVMIEGDCGASSIQLDPFFSQNKFFYVSYCTSQYDNTVSRFTFDPQYFNAVLLSQKEILSTTEPRAVRPVHGVGTMSFDSDGAMLIHFGEKGITTNAQDAASPLGKIVRIVPNRDPDGSGYDIPSDNPRAGVDGADSIVFAEGFRNPWRGTFDASGRYWIADVGSSKAEEINLLQPGANYGWPKHEGACMEQCEGFINPVLSYDHTPEHAYVQEDPYATTSKFRTPWVCTAHVAQTSDPYAGSLDYDVIFGDMFAGWIRGLAADDSGAIIRNNAIAHLPFVSSCQVGKDGYVYLGTMFTAKKVDEDGNPSFADPSELNGALWRMVMPSSPIDEIE